MNETLEQIQKLAEQRQELYRSAARNGSRERNRIDEITAQLDKLWDQYRREQALARYHNSGKSVTSLPTLQRLA